MCGIVAYLGKKTARPILLEGLKRLEYRGYDSAGIAVLEGGKINVEKCIGRVANLEDRLETRGGLRGTIGMGHTRWATHGGVTDANAHPHISSDRKIALIHNGVIENYASIKKFLLTKGYSFQSETDTEVLAHLMQQRGCTGYGIEIDDTNVHACAERGVKLLAYGTLCGGFLSERWLDQPGPIQLQSVNSADWSVPLAGLLNLKSAAAVQAGLKDREEPIQVYAHVLQHPQRGNFLVDTGVSHVGAAVRPLP